MNTLPPTRGVLVNETGERRVSCIGRGNPSPVIQWTKDGQTMDAAWYTIHAHHQPVDNFSTVVTSSLSWRGTVSILQNKVDVLHVPLTELHAAHQNLPYYLLIY